jgi:hypothetical protein
MRDGCHRGGMKLQIDSFVLLKAIELLESVDTVSGKSERLMLMESNFNALSSLPIGRLSFVIAQSSH